MNSEPQPIPVKLTSLLSINSATSDSITTTFTVSCGEGPFLLSKLNGARITFFNIQNSGNCDVTLFAISFLGTQIQESVTVLPATTILSSYTAPEGADSVLSTDAKETVRSRLQSVGFKIKIAIIVGCSIIYKRRLT